MFKFSRMIMILGMVFFAMVLVNPTPGFSAENVGPDTAGGKGGGKPQKYPIGVPKTGQTIQYASGDDGDLQKGVPWPDPRFTDNGNGTVTDNLTGLMWLKDANCIATHYPDFDNDGTPGDGRVTWQHALDFVAGINDGTYSQCGAGYADWRLPNVRELLSLLDYGAHGPALPVGHPFMQAVWNVDNAEYWSSTSTQPGGDAAWQVNLYEGQVLHTQKDSGFFFNYVWPVRGGQ